ncbi:hypothetical protein V6Z11_D09G201800 [Gossypium hirsutum]
MGRAMRREGEREIRPRGPVTGRPPEARRRRRRPPHAVAGKGIEWWRQVGVLVADNWWWRAKVGRRLGFFSSLFFAENCLGLGWA